ncbi:MAG: hypothetical protein P4L51_23770 [Puia sp.]|nr:hypothetical protein [Puia sp.]
MSTSKTPSIDRFADRPATEQRLSPQITAFRQPFLPVNPIPFLEALATGCRELGTEWIRSDAAQALLHILLQQSYGQRYLVDSDEEFFRLLTIFEP